VTGPSGTPVIPSKNRNLHAIFAAVMQSARFPDIGIFSNSLIYMYLLSLRELAQRLHLSSNPAPMTRRRISRRTGVTRMKKFAIAAATATALTLTLGNVAFAQTTQSPMVVAAGEITEVKEDVSDTWITTKVKADLVTEKGVPGTDIEVETKKGVVALSSKVAVTDSQKEMAVAIAKKIKGVKGVMADGLKTE
jgi:hyperosmotically inducible protein